MRFRRSTLILVCAFTVLSSAVLALVVRQARGDDLDQTLWMNALLVLIGILMLARVTLGPAATVVTDRCLRCGAQTYDTARSQDRRHVRTCFTCGHEDAAVDAAAAPRRPDGPFEPPAYNDPVPRGEKN